METQIKNQIKLSMLSTNENIAFARAAAAAFAAQLDLTLTTIDEIKVAVSEAVSNSVIHGYGDSSNSSKQNYIDVIMKLFHDRLEFTVIDYGRGIADINAARQPSFSTDPERMGLGFVFMDSFMDDLEVISELGQGTTVRMTKMLVPSTEH